MRACACVHACVCVRGGGGGGVLYVCDCVRVYVTVHICFLLSDGRNSTDPRTFIPLQGSCRR